MDEARRCIGAPDTGVCPLWCQTVEDWILRERWKTVLQRESRPPRLPPRSPPPTKAL